MCLSDPISRVRIGNNMSYSSKIRNGLKQGDALSPLLFNFDLEYEILRIKGDKNGSLNQLFVYADDVDLIEDDIDELQSNTDDLVEGYDEIGLQINIDKIKYTITSRNKGMKEIKT